MAARKLSMFDLVLFALSLACQIYFAESSSANEAIQVELKIVPGEKLPVGELNLGHISGNEPVESNFVLVNGTNRELSIEGVRTSCSCTFIELKQMTLAAGEASSHQGLIRLKQAKGRGEVIVGNIALMHSKSTEPVGLIFIKATVDRPFSIAKANVEQVIERDPVEFKVPIDVDPTISVDLLRCYEHEGHLKVSVIRETAGKQECSIVLRGEYDRLLKAKSCVVSIVHKDPNDREFKGTMSIDFRNGNLLRVTPRSAEVVDGQIEFMIFKYSKIKLDQITVTSESGEKLTVECAARSPSLVSAKVKLPSGFQESRLKISDGKFDVWIDVEK